jgi:hypothetical protein
MASKYAKIMVEPTMTGMSKRPTARYRVMPRPGHRKMVSVTIAPVLNRSASAKLVMILGRVGAKYTDIPRG